MQQGANKAIVPATVAATNEPPKKTLLVIGTGHGPSGPILSTTHHYNTVVACGNRTRRCT
jgi:hypothetical protein